MSGAIDRSTPPVPEAPQPFSFPAFERRRLSNGIELLLAPIDRFPLVDLELILPAGAIHNPTTAPGLANFTAAVLDEGTENRGSQEIADSVERLGGYLGTAAGWDTLQIHCGLLSRHLATGLDLAAEIARRPAFPDVEVERIGGQIRAEIERRAAQPAAVASEALMAAIYGDSVYGRPRIGTDEAIGRLDRNDLAGFYSRHATAAGATFVLVGDFDPATAGDRLEELLGDWRTPPATAEPTLVVPAARHREVTLVDRPGAQTELRLGHAGPPRDHPDFAAATVLNSILGGKFMSRINLNLRERHGYTYGASSAFDWRRGPGPFVVATAVETEHAAAAAREVLYEIERLREEAVTDEELAETKSYLIGVFPYTTQRLGDIATRLRRLAVFGLADDYYDTWGERIAGVDAEQVLAAARRHLRPTELSVVAVGPADELEPGLAEVGPVRRVTGA